MKKSASKKTAALLLTAVMTSLLFSGCSNSGTASTTAASGSASTTAAASSGESTPKILNWCVTGTTSNISPFDNNTDLVDYVQAKLYRYIPNEEGTGITLVPDLAAGEPYTEDGYTWFIDIDPNAKWANGDVINADTFMYSWKMALDPVMLFASPSGLAQNIIKVENAYEYYTQASSGNPVNWEDVGFKKVDDDTVSVKTTEKYTATQVMQHFQMRYTGPVYQPIFDACISADKASCTYGTEASLYMASGAFELTSWTKGTERVFTKNNNYLHADEVKLDGMVCKEVADESTQLELFQKGELDLMQLKSNGYQLYGEDPRTLESESTTIRELEFNFENPSKTYLGNLNFRKAIYYAVDRATIGKLTNTTGQSAFLPDSYTVSADGTSLRDLPGGKDYLPANNGYDPEKAKQYFEAALQECGVTSVSINLMYNQAAEATKIASEYIQSSLTKLFGADRFSMTLTAMNNADLVKLMRTSQKGPNSDWDMGWGGWDLTAAQYSANRKFEVYRTTDSRRFSQYPVKEIDEMYALSVSEEYRMDESKLASITMEMEKIFLENIESVPVLQEKSFYIFSDRVILPVQHRVNIIGYPYQYFDVK